MKYNCFHSKRKFPCSSNKSDEFNDLDLEEFKRKFKENTKYK